MAPNSDTDGLQQLRIGVSPLSWVNEVLADFGAGTTPETVLEEAATAGYQGVELSRIFPRDPAVLSALLRQYRLSLVSGWYSGFLADRSFEEEIQAVRDHAELLKQCGATIMVYGECGRMAPDALDIPMSKRGRLGPEEWVGYGDRLSRFAAELEARYGLTLVYHYHLMMVVETLDDVRSLMRATDPAVHLLLDTGHAYAAGFDYSALISEFGPRIAHVHLKDVRADVLETVRKQDLSFNQAVRSRLFTVPGDGSLEYGPLAAFLRSKNYRGWLLVEAEQDPSKAPPFATVQRAHHFIAREIVPA